MNTKPARGDEETAGKNHSKFVAYFSRHANNDEYLSRYAGTRKLS